MLAFDLHKIRDNIRPFIARIAPWRKRQKHVEQIHAHRNTELPPEKKEELEKLCNMLFRKKELITSGKLQLIGLTKIKQRMGKRWLGLSKLVYDTTEDVIRKHMEKGDIFIRYKDDTYLILFAHASLETGQAKAAVIAQEIRERLFALEEKELRDIEIREATSQIRGDSFANGGFTDFLDTFTSDDFNTGSWRPTALTPVPEEEAFDHSMINGTDVDSSRTRVRKEIPVNEGALPLLAPAQYLPLWDVKRNALTTYLVLPRSVEQESATSLDMYSHLCLQQGPGNRVLLDIKILKDVAAELSQMEKDGRKLLIACPVQYSTLHDYDSYEQYKSHLDKISRTQRPYLVLYIVNSEKKKLPLKDAYWFAAPLRQLCRHVFAEIPLRRDINFNYLRNTGIDVAGIRIDGTATSEQETISLITSFCTKAKALKIPLTFITGVTSLSLTTSAVCAGFDFLGGGAVHNAVDRPDNVHKYRHEDLIKMLSQK